MDFVQAKALGLDELKHRKEAMSSQEEIDPNVWTVINNAISELEFEEQQTKQHEERVKEQQEHIDGLMEYVQGLGMFEATVGDQLTSGLGLTEYSEQRQLFNQTLYAVVTSLQKSLIDKHNVEVALKDEKVISLGRRITELEVVLNQEKLDHQNTTNALEAEKELHSQTLEKLAKKADRVTELEQELEAAKKTQQAFTPSGDVNEHLERLRKASEEKFKQEAAASYIPVTLKEPVDAFKKHFRVILAETGEEKIIDGIVQSKYRLVDEEEAARFRSEAAATVQANPVQDHTLDNPLEIEPPIFQIPEDPIDGLAQGNMDGEMAKRADQEVAERTLEERVAALELVVFGEPGQVA